MLRACAGWILSTHYYYYVTHVSCQVQKFLQQVACHHPVAHQVAPNLAGDGVVDVVGQRAHSLLACTWHLPLLDLHVQLVT